MPHDFPPWSVIRYYFDQWTHNGKLERLHTLLRERLRVTARRSAHPGGGVVGSKSTKPDNQPSVSGYDGGKKRTSRKRHLLVDTEGLLLTVATAANNLQRVGDWLDERPRAQTRQSTFERLYTVAT